MAKKRRALSPPQPQDQPGSFFSNSKQTIITGSQFIAQIPNVHDKEFNLLRENVATTAFHDAPQSFDRPPCHEHTREAVIKEIFDWIGEASRTSWILWLNGAAGCGKSAIGQSIAELCISQGILVACFFFFRTDPARNTLSPLVATLAYQIIRNLPSTKELITKAIQLNPLIFKQSLSTQLDTIIIQPLRTLSLSTHVPTLVLIIDGVDECNGDSGQKELICTVERLLRGKDLPIIVLFASRTENQIKMAFNGPDLKDILHRLSLDDNYQSYDDIRLFLNDTFRFIHETHPLNTHLNRNWPGPVLVEEIVNKASGQFIYASIVMKFLSLPRANPATQLDIIRGLVVSSATPFAQLDALYMHIFSQVQEPTVTLLILACCVIGGTTDPDLVALTLLIRKLDIEVALIDLSSVIAFDHGSIRFLHKSLPDFLTDQRRSQGYYIAAAVWSTRSSALWLRAAKAGRFSIFPGDRPVKIFLKCLRHAEGSPELHEAIVEIGSQFFKDYIIHAVEYLTCVQQMDFHDGGVLYNHQLNVATRYMLRHKHTKYLAHLALLHDISAAMADIDRERAENLLAADPKKRGIGGKNQSGKLGAWFSNWF